MIVLVMPVFYNNGRYKIRIGSSHLQILDTVGIIVL